MPHSLRYDPDIDCIILTFDGTVTINMIKEVAPQVAKKSQETGCLRILNDMSAAEIDVSFMDVFKSPEVMDKSNVLRITKRALVAPTSFTEAHFLETVTRNRGHNLMVFHDIDEARQWLLSDAEVSQ